MPLTFCVSEDRALEEVGLRLTLCSLRRYCPDARIFLYRPRITKDFRDWITSGFPRITVIPELPPGAYSWNCKPHTLLPLLEQGHEEVIWVDSDIVLSRSCGYLFTGLRQKELGIAQEPLSQPMQGSVCRTTGWGLPVGRVISRTLNTCIVRVTAHHVPLLRRWIDLLATEEYRHYQTRPFHERPIHCLSDQDVLNALLGAAEFADVPIHEVRTGIDVIHSGGALAYSFRERLEGLFRPIPPFIHGQGTKLWWAFDASSLVENRGSWWFRRRLILELSPYFAAVKAYRRELGIQCPWMDYASPLGLLNRLIGFGHFALRGFLLTAIATCLVFLHRLLWRRW